MKRKILAAVFLTVTATSAFTGTVREPEYQKTVCSFAGRQSFRYRKDRKNLTASLSESSRPSTTNGERGVRKRSYYGLSDNKCFQRAYTYRFLPVDRTDAPVTYACRPSERVELPHSRRRTLRQKSGKTLSSCRIYRVSPPHLRRYYLHTERVGILNVRSRKYLLFQSPVNIDKRGNEE